MSDEPFGRQPRPISIAFLNGEQEDRDLWMAKIKRFLENQSCVVDQVGNVLAIYPDAVND